ncbi:MAG: ACP S-malonyltransferase [Coriobacteriaceae bacterium]|jgi:[acyl-carrier-protein] S-malonyltransferase|nr:ACP S-malonyltransferase [Coriobacteriaceae bacterium]
METDTPAATVDALVGVCIDATAPALMFSGQGSQSPGMGSDLLGDPLAAEIFACASDMFHRDIAALVTEGPSEALHDTRAAQAAIACLSLSLYRLLREGGLSASAVLGFSLGQVSALYAAEMLTMEETFAFLAKRAELMADAAQETPGAMCALLGADEVAAQGLCDHAAHGDVLVIANYNCPGQIVVSGTLPAIERAEAAWTAAGKRCSRLATAGAFHSPLMGPAAMRLAAYLSQVGFRDPKMPLICNTDARPLDAQSAAQRLCAHLTSPVRFEQSVTSLCRAGARHFVEVGFGGVLVALVKRIDKASIRNRVEGRESLDAYLAAYRSQRSPATPTHPLAAPVPFAAPAACSEGDVQERKPL